MTPRVGSLSAAWLKRRGSRACSFCRPEDEGSPCLLWSSPWQACFLIRMQMGRSWTQRAKWGSAPHCPRCLLPCICIACRFVATGPFSPFPFVPNVVFRVRTLSKILSNWTEEAMLEALWDLRAGTDIMFSFSHAFKKMICVWLWILADFKLLPIFCIFQETKIWPNAQFTSDWMEHWGLKKTPLNTGVNWLLLLSKVCRSSVRQTWLWSILKYSASDTKIFTNLGDPTFKIPSMAL